MDNKAQFSEKQLGKSQDMRLLRRLYPFARPYRLLLLATLGLMILITVCELGIPYITKIAIDSYIVPGYGGQERQAEKEWPVLEVDLSNPEISVIVEAHPGKFDISGGTAAIEYRKTAELPPGQAARLRQSDMDGLVYAAVALLFIVFLNFGASFFQVFLMETIGQGIMHDLRMNLFSHLQSLSLRFFTQNPTGRLVTRVTNDIQNMHEMFTSVIIFVLKDLFLVTGITIVLFSIDWQLALASYAIFPFVFYAAGKFAGTARGAFRTLRVKLAEINSQFAETIGGMAVVQLFRRETANFAAFRNLNHDYFSAGMRQITVFAFFMPFIELMSSVVLAVVIFYGGTSLLAGRITLGTLVVFISYLRMFFRPIRDIAEKYNITLNAMSSAERIFLLLEENDREGRKQERQETELMPVPEKIEEITFDRVWFSYTPGQPVLQDISLSIRGGKTVAVVGPTGAGKTSLINLIARFYEPDAGSIRLNEEAIENFPIEKLRSKIALVMQDPFLFSGSIKENIFPGRASSVSEETFHRVLEHANCSGFIKRLPDGENTPLSEGASSLSSGQRQLLAIARALAMDPELIIFDEATSYIDSETEQQIQQALANLLAGRTAILIAHRLSTAKIADTILVMNHGCIIESGTHEQLMAANGFYRRMVEIQG
ncbi:MAG: ABC transporter ATP-binding protein [Desulfosalsimonadaceae bacterium]